MINTPEDAENLVRYTRYAPRGVRSFGPTRAAFAYGAQYWTAANESVVTLAMIETAEALENLDAIVSTPDLSGVYIGPSDLSLSMGRTPKLDHDDPTVLAAIERIRESAHRAGIKAGIHLPLSVLREVHDRRRVRPGDGGQRSPHLRRGAERRGRRGQGLKQPRRPERAAPPSTRGRGRNKGLRRAGGQRMFVPRSLGRTSGRPAGKGSMPTLRVAPETCTEEGGRTPGAALSDMVSAREAGMAAPKPARLGEPGKSADRGRV